MMIKWSQKRILAMLTALALLVSTLSGDVVLSIAAENNIDISSGDAYISSWDGSDVSGSDVSGPDASGSDVSSPDVSSPDVSGPDASGPDVSSPDVIADGMMQQIQQEAFFVTDSVGQVFGGYDEWAELLNDFKVNGDVGKEYVISVHRDGVIGKVMPSNAALITLTPASETQEILLFESGTLNMTTPLKIDAKGLCVSSNGKVVNINTKGKTLTLNGTRELGTVKGTSKASLNINGDVELQGNLQTFQYITVSGTLKVSGNVSAVTNLVLADGTVYLSAGKSFTVTNVDAAADGCLGFPAEGTLPNAKITGQVSGVLNLKLFEESEGSYTEIQFPAGSKLLTASKAGVEQFALAGEGQVCYKKSGVLYVGAEILALYSGENYVGTYSQWDDIKVQINTVKDKAAVYQVLFLDDYVINGTFSMPSKGRYAGLNLRCGNAESVTLKATGGFTLTGDVILGDNINLAVSQISGTAWNLAVGENSSVTTTGNVTIKNLTLGTGAWMRIGGKLTVKSQLDAAGSNELVLTTKKGAAVKDTIADGRVTIRMIDKSGNAVTPVPNTTVISVTGNSYATQYCLMDALNMELPLYRKGNALKVQGTVVTPITLFYVQDTEEVCLGSYASLADVKTEIGRRKLKEASYTVRIDEDIFVKGALPLPAAGTYKEINFVGETIRLTGNVTLTGNTCFYNVIRKVKNEKADAPLTITLNLSKYTMTVPENVSMDNIGSVSGSTGSCLWIAAGVEQVIGGNLKVARVVLDGVLRVDGDITVTDVQAGANNRLDYNLSQNITIKGNVDGEAALVLNPLKNGQQSAYTQGMKVLSNAPKVVISGLMMAQDTELVFYRDGNVVRLGAALITVFDGTTDYESVAGAEHTSDNRFARINDAMDYMNTCTETDFVVRLEENIPSSGAFKAPVQGKNIVLCGLEGERKILNLTGSMTFSSCSLTVRNIELKSSNTVPGVILKNEASLWLADTGINTLSAAAGTAVTLEGEVSVKGAVTGGCDMTIIENAVLRAGSNLTVETLTLDAAAEGIAQLRLQTGKKLTVKGMLTTPEDGVFIINHVDKNDKLASIGIGTVMVVTAQGQVSQFKTENIMPGSFQAWNLIKLGSNIQTSEASPGDGEWSGDYL